MTVIDTSPHMRTACQTIHHQQTGLGILERSFNNEMKDEARIVLVCRGLRSLSRVFGGP